jgi:hypothetical protein
MKDYRQTLVIIVIAVLFTIFVQTLVDPFITTDNNDCYEARPYKPNVSEAEQLAINEDMQVCYDALEEQREKEQLLVFIISAVVGIIAILVGLSMQTTSSFNFMMANGLVLGGLFTIFVGTMRGWGGLGEFIRPVVMLAELVIVSYVAYKRLNTSSTVTSKKKSKKK